MTQSTKHLVFIVSGGRTGTQFLGDLLSEMINGAFSVHEPDVLDIHNRHIWNRLRIFGIYHMVIGRILGKTGIRNLAQRYLSGDLTDGELLDQLHRHRDGYYDSIAADLIVESYPQWFGLLPAIFDLYENHKVVGLIRDPRTWVTSMMNHGSQYGPRDWVTKVGLRRLNPNMIGDLEYIEQWPSMSRFERNCWLWKTAYSIIARYIPTKENTQMFRYEDLFLSVDQSTHMEKFLDFITKFPKREFAYSFNSETLKTPRNVSSDKGFPNWPAWDPIHAKRLKEMCLPLMSQYNYGTEPAWLELTS